MRKPSFAALAAAGALAVGVSFAAVGATKLDTPNAHDLSRAAGLPHPKDLARQARRAGVCIDRREDGVYRVTVRNDARSGASRTDGKIFERVREAVSLGLITRADLPC